MLSSVDVVSCARISNGMTVGDYYGLIPLFLNYYHY
jgi:hypothetical protein